MANSPLVSIRIPPETLERIDQLAQKHYPSRRSGRKPNRSQVILDAIEQYLNQSELQSFTSSNVESPLSQAGQNRESSVVVSLEEANPNYAVIQTLEPEDQGQLFSPEMLNNVESVWSQSTGDDDKNTIDLETSSTRKYIDLWLDYFSYMGKLAKPWFITRQ